MRGNAEPVSTDVALSAASEMYDAQTRASSASSLDTWRNQRREQGAVGSRAERLTGEVGEEADDGVLVLQLDRAA